MSKLLSLSVVILSTLVHWNAAGTTCGPEILTLAAGPFSIEKDGDGYDRLVMDGYRLLGTPGEPALPTRVFNILVPPDILWDTLELVTLASDGEILPDRHNLRPAAPDTADADGGLILDWGQNAQALFEGRNTEVYERDAFFPAAPVEMLPRSQLRKWKFARVSFRPLQYNPVTGELRLIKQVQIQLVYQRAEESAAGQVGRALDQPVGRSTAQRAEQVARLEAARDTVMDSLAPELFYNFATGREAYATAHGGYTSGGSANEAAQGGYTSGGDADGNSHDPDPSTWDGPTAEDGVDAGQEEDQVAVQSQSGDYVIITTNAMVNGSAALASFVAHKEARGHSVLVVTETDYGTLAGQAPNHRAEKIRQWLINNYLGRGIEYVLLIGDPTPFEMGEGDVPMKMCWPRRGMGDNEESPTDAFYADLTGNWDADGDGYYGEWSDYATAGGVDLSMEVWVGRIPVYTNDFQSLDSILRKIMTYEQAGSPEWRKSALLPMSFSTTAYDGAPLAEQMQADYLSPRGYAAWTQYQQGGGACSLNSAYPSDQELRGGTVVRDRWAAHPYGVVSWWGHGSVTEASVGTSGCWDGTLFSILQTGALNDDYPAFTYQCSCTNGYPENPRNLQYALLKRGGIATVSAVRVSWFNTDVGYGAFDGSSTNAGIGYEYVERLSRSRSAGRALCEAKLAVAADLGGRSSRLMNQFDFNLYGDPSVSLDGCEEGGDCDACLDQDGDGYGSPASYACTHPEEDCDDTDPGVNPGVSEIQGNGADDDCRPDTPAWGTPASVLGAEYARSSKPVNYLALLVLVPAGIVRLLARVWRQ